MPIFFPSTFFVLPVLAAVGNAAQAGSEAGVTPLGKVLEMLDGMSKTCKEQKNAEEVENAAYSQWCKGTQDDFSRSIKQAEQQIEQLQATIEKAEADAEEHGSAASEELSRADALEAEAANATAIRKKQNEDYTATHHDFTTSLDALDRAKNVLHRRMADVPQSLLQIRDSVHLPDEAKWATDAALLALNEDPKANAYEFQSNSVMQMLEKLTTKFQDERLALQKAEIAARGNYGVLMQRLTNSIEEAKSVASKKNAFKGQRLEDAAGAKSQLSATETSKAEDEKSLAETVSQCQARAEEFAKNQEVRADEIKAIEEAASILRSDAVSGNAANYLPAALLQGAPSFSLVQLGAGSGTSYVLVRERIVERLRGKAQSLGSRYLAFAASHAAVDNFAKVKKIIADLIFKLQEEANSEADHHAFCTSELAKNKLTRDDKQMEVEQLTANIEKGQAESQQLVTELSELSDASQELQRQRADAQANREAERATNAKTVADARDSQVAVTRATQVLKAFYAAKASESEGESLVQVEADAPYRGLQAESGGIIGLLEVVLSDFARLETQTSSAEEEAQSAFETFMAQSAEDLSVKDAEMKHKESLKEGMDSQVVDLKKQLELTQEELDAALEYYEKLKPDCSIDSRLSYQERVQRREEEIQSLREALEALEQQNLA